MVGERILRFVCKFRLSQLCLSLKLTPRCIHSFSFLMPCRQEQLLEWGKTWPIAHRQPGAVLPPPPLSRDQIHLMYRTQPCLSSLALDASVLTFQW